MFVELKDEVSNKTFAELQTMAEKLLAPKVVSEYTTKEVLKDMGLLYKQQRTKELPVRKELTRDTVRAICDYLCKCEDIIGVPPPVGGLIKTFNNRRGV